MKTLAAIIVVLAVLGGAAYWYTYRYTRTTPPTPTETTAEATTTASVSEQVLPSGTASSNQALDQDLSAIDSQLSGLSTDTASASASLNDKPVSQSSL
jgi:hypothetical protein